MTDKKHITFNIDWLQYMTALPDWLNEWPMEYVEGVKIAKTAVPHLYQRGEPYERVKGDRPGGMQGYTALYDLGYATVHVNPNRPDMGMQTRMTGGELGIWRDLGGDDKRLVQFVRGVAGKTSRIDLAFDLFNYNIDLAYIYKQWVAGKVGCRARKVTPITSGVMGEDRKVTESTTLYFGSRQSEVMVRMYDKGKERGTDLDWTRVEIELKGDKAHAYTVAMDANGIPETGRAILADYFFSMPFKFWKDILKGEIAPLPTVGRKLTERESWIMNVIIPMLRQEIENEWDGITETGITREVEALIREHWHTRAMAIRKQYGML